MVLRAYIVAVAVVFFGLESEANPALTCIGKGNTPSSDKFYANKINQLIEESEKLDTQIASLERRLPEIDRNLEEFKRNKIPKLFREFERNPHINSHPTLKVTFQELKNFFYKHENQHADMLIANNKSEEAFKREDYRIYRQRLLSQNSMDKIHESFREHFSNAQEKFEREFPKMDNEIRRLEESFRDRDLALARELREKTSPPLFGKPLTRQQISKIRRDIQEARARLKQERERVLSVLRQKREEYIRNYSRTIQQLKDRLAKERELYAARMGDLEDEAKLNSSDYQSELDSHQANFDRQIDQDNRSFDSAIRNIRALLQSHPNPQVRQFAESDGIIAAIGKDKDAIDALVKEKTQIPITLAELKKEREKYKFISMWWNEQGKANDQIPTEAGTCIGCEETSSSPIAQLLKRKAPHIKLACVEASIRGKNAFNNGIMCEDSNKQVRSSKDICVTQRMAEYTQWALNNAFDCLSTPGTIIDPQTVFRKLNNESTFKFFYSYDGGHGLMQTVRIAQNEILGLDAGGRPSGRKHLARVMNQNKQSCQEYKSIIDFEKEARLDQLAQKKETNALNQLKAAYPDHNKRLFHPNETCNFVSLQDGIHRNILNGLGLFIYYKQEAQDDILRNFFPNSNIAKNPQFSQIRDIVSLIYYGPLGRGGGKAAFQRSVLNEVKARFRDLARMPAHDFEKLVAQHIPYIRAIKRSEGSINGSSKEDELQCVEK